MTEESSALWRIKDWNERFENHHSRPLKSLSWLHFPLDQGDGYADLMDHPEGAAHLGIWLAIVMIAAKCDPRGTLRRSAGNPHTGASIARESRAEERLVEDCLPRLVRIGWIEDISTVCNATRESRAEAKDGRENPATEEKRREEKRRETPTRETRSGPGNFINALLSQAIPPEELSAAYQRHHKRVNGEPLHAVKDCICRMAAFDLERFREVHPRYCLYWDQRDWNFNTLTLLGWIRADMPEPPPEVVLRAGVARESSSERITRVMEERIRRDGKL